MPLPEATEQGTKGSKGRSVPDYQIRSKEDMNGKKLKNKYPKFAKKHNINDEDFLYFVGDKIRVLRKGSFTRNN